MQTNTHTCAHTQTHTHMSSWRTHTHTHTHTHTRTSIIDLNRNVDTGEIKVDILAEVVVILQVQVKYVLRVVITHLLPLHTSITAKYTNSFIHVNMNYPITHSTFHTVSTSAIPPDPFPPNPRESLICTCSYFILQFGRDITMNLKQEEAQGAHAESTHKGVN